MKKIVAFLMILCAGTGAFAQTEADFEVDITANGVKITGYTGKVRQVWIPAEIGGLPVKEIGEMAFLFNTELMTSVTIPDSVTSIGDRAFSGNQLTSVTIPNSVTSIGNHAFLDNQLTSVTLPSTIKNIDAQAFYGCSALTTVTIPELVTSLTFYEAYDTENATRPSGTRTNTANRAFEGTKLGLASQARLNQLGYTGNF